VAEQLVVQSTASFEQLLALRADWHALEIESDGLLPFQTWEWCVAWWRHLREDSMGVRDLLRVCVIRDSEGQALGIAPLILTERPAFGPVRLRHFQLIGADPNITEIRTMLCRPGRAEECHAALRDYFASRRHEWHWIAWEGLSSQTLTTRGTADTLSHIDSKSAFVLALTPSWNGMRTGLGRNIKESLRKCYNSLKRDGMSGSLEIVDHPSAIEPALEDFFQLHSARARLKRGPIHADVFASAQARAFLIEVCQLLSSRGVAKLFRLRVDGRIVATRLGFEMGQSLYLYYSGWDPAFARYSVMTTLVAEILQDAIRRGVSSVNLSSGRDVSKTRWGPEEVTYMSGLEFSSPRMARVLYFGYAAAARVGTNPFARAALPWFLVRRSGKRSDSQEDSAREGQRTVSTTVSSHSIAQQ
jgi:CelD/BcsL family acetyltransferase involved in cellulose biosynthesis